MKGISRQHEELNFLYSFLSIPVAIAFPFVSAFSLTSVEVVPFAILTQIYASRLGVNLGRKYQLSKAKADLLANISGITLVMSVVITFNLLQQPGLRSAYVVVQILFAITLALDGWRRYGVLWHLSEASLRTALKKYDSWL